MSSPPAPRPAFLRGASEMAGLIAGFDWQATALGPLAQWPAHVRHTVALMLQSGVPMVALFGAPGTMIYNDAYSVFAGGRHPRLLGAPVREGWPEVADFNDHVMRVGLAGGTLSYQDQELTLRRRGVPEPAWMDLDYSPVLDEAGQPAAVLAIVVETTEKVRAERGLREANLRKDEFLAMLAHELRNPLAPIATGSALLARRPDDVAAVRRTSEMIERQVRHMSELVDDLLDVSRVTRGLIEIERSLLDLQGVVQHALEQARPLIEGRRHAVAVDVPPGEVIVAGDRTRLVQVLVNLLANAAKYTPPRGRLRVELACSATHATIAVQDDGAGIEPELLAHVFDLFTQGARTPDRSQGGLGIGLALVKAIVGLHEGEVRAESAGRGRGSRFTIRLPLAPVQQHAAGAQEPAAAAAGGAGLRILVTDDNVDAAETLGLLLQFEGHDVRVCYSGEHSLETADAFRPQACILDVGLPDMTGLELVRRLQRRDFLRDALFIALTGYGQPHDRAASAQAGFHHHLVKPVEPVALHALLAAHAAATAARRLDADRGRAPGA